MLLRFTFTLKKVANRIIETILDKPNRWATFLATNYILFRNHKGGTEIRCYIGFDLLL